MGSIYRGYEINREKIDSQIRFVVMKDGAQVNAATSEEAAMSWVDAQRRKQLGVGRIVSGRVRRGAAER